jgi:hypothetical protein
LTSVWLAEHPDYRLHQVQSSVANDAQRPRNQVESPQD